MESSVKNRTIEFVKSKGITMKSFENKCGLSTGYVTSMRKGFGIDKLNNVLTAFPELNREWLLYGEGEMLKDSVTQISHGDNSTNIAGNGNTIRTNTGDTAVLQERVKLLEKLLDEKDKLLAEKERLLEEKERLIKVLMER